MTALNTDTRLNDRYAPPGTVDALLVDDDETWARTQRRVLERHYDAVSVSTTHTLQDALYALETGSPDCLICDYQLGDGTGLELLEAIRRDHPKLPFVLVTGQGDESVASAAIREHVTDYVRKDELASQPDLLATRVASVVEAYRTEQALERERRSKEALRRLVTASTTRQELGQAFANISSTSTGTHSRGSASSIATARSSRSPRPATTATSKQSSSRGRNLTTGPSQR